MSLLCRMQMAKKSTSPYVPAARQIVTTDLQLKTLGILPQSTNSRLASSSSLLIFISSHGLHRFLIVKIFSKQE